MSQPVPARIERELRATLLNLRSLHHIIQETREALDDRLGGGGRYEADAYLNQAEHISRGRAYIAEFRKIAATKDIDAEAVIADLGGEPEFLVSARAMPWIEDQLARLDAERALHVLVVLDKVAA